MVAAMSLHGMSISAERERAAAALHLGGRQRVLDVACGPGNFTSFFAGLLAEDGFVIGLDNSVPMMERAVRDNSCDRAVYMRGDVLDLPFNNRAFDVVSCFAALHLVPEPLGVLHEMVRVLSPGGRIAVMTTYGRESFLVRKGLELGATICGVASLRPHHRPNLLRGRRPGRHQAAAARNLPVRGRSPAGAGHRVRAVARSITSPNVPADMKEISCRTRLFRWQQEQLLYVVVNVGTFYSLTVPVERRRGRCACCRTREGPRPGIVVVVQ